MIVYRVTYRDKDEHRGHSWHPNLVQATAHTRDTEHTTEIEGFQTGTTKAQLLQFLNRVAGHPDNG